MDYPFHPSGLGLRDDRHTGKQTARPAPQTTLPAPPRPKEKFKTVGHSQGISEI